MSEKNSVLRTTTSLFILLENFHACDTLRGICDLRSLYYETNNTELGVFASFAGCGEDSVPGVSSFEFSSGAAKLVELGVVEFGETAVVAVIPLNRDTGNFHYDGSIDIMYEVNSKMAAFEEEASARTGKSGEGVWRDNPVQREFTGKLREMELDMLRSGMRVDFDAVRSRSTCADVRDFKNGFNDDPNVMMNDSSTVTASLEATGTYCCIYVADGATVAAGDITELQETFDSHIFPTIMQYYGHGDYGTRYDVDENGKVIILIEDMGEGDENGTMLGYFYGGDYVSPSEVPRSNEADMFYINSYGFSGSFGINYVLSVLGHEFQHLVFFVESAYSGRDPSVDTIWINEAFSGLSEYLTGYNGMSDDTHVTDKYFAFPEEISLLYWGYRLEDYGASNIFGLYLFDQFGAAILKEVNSSAKGPAAAIDEYSKNNDSAKRSFEELLRDWALANYITGLGIHDRYSYEISNSNYSGSLSPVRFTDKPAAVSVASSDTEYFTVDNTGVQYFTIVGNGSEVDINIQLSTKTGVIVYNPE